MGELGEKKVDRRTNGWTGGGVGELEEGWVNWRRGG